MKPTISILLAGLFIASVADTGSCAGAGRTAPTGRPNILWLVSEDNAPLLGCYGDPLARTPTLDRLAREGVMYERCFTQPVCAPSRFTLITGMYAVSHGPAQHMRAQGKTPAWLEGFPVLLRQAGYYTANNSKTDYNAPIGIKEAWDESGRNAHWRKRTTPAQPFFSVFNHEVTHESCLFPAKDVPLDFTPTDPAKVRIPPYQPDTPEMRADWARYYDHLALMDRQITAKLKALEEDGLAENTIVFYYSDNGGVLPRSKRFLQQSGTRVPLIVYFPPKWRHLAPAAPGSRIKDPVASVDFAPTVLSLAGVEIPKYMQGHAFAGPAKASPNRFVFLTRDRMDERYDMMRSVVDGRWLYIRNYRPDLPYVQPLEYMFQARGYQSWAKLAAEGRLTPATGQFWGEKPSEELYDLEADPDNVNNLAAAPEHRATLRRMRAALKARVIEVQDNGFLPEGSPLEGYESSRKPGAYPVERVFTLATLASDRNPEQLARLTKALDDSCEPVRWWAAQGCTMLGKQAAPAEAALRKRLDDPSGSVQVAAAEALARMDHVEPALPVLERWLRNASAPWAGLQAANVLDRLGEQARPLLPAMREALERVGKEDGPTNPFQFQRRILERSIAVLEGKASALAYPESKEGATLRLESKTVVVRKYDVLPYVENGYTRRFKFDSYGNPKLEELRRRYTLDAVVAAGKDEFHRQILLLNWAHHQFKKFGRPSAEVRGALEILKAVEEGHTFHCAHYAQVFVSAAASLGWVDRELALRRHQDPPGGGSTEHSTTEIWSNQYRKWVMMDPTANMHIRKNGTPLNAYEIRQEWFEHGGRDLEFVIGKEGKTYRKADLPIFLGRFAGFGDLTVPVDELDKYGFIGFIPNTDLMDAGLDYAKMFIIKDKLCDGTRWHTRTVPANPAVDPYFAINQAAVRLVPERDRIRVALQTMTPNFKSFETRIDGGLWNKTGDSLLWKLHPGLNRLEVRVANQFGVEGPISSVEVMQ